jgi:hypothetical protein
LTRNSAVFKYKSQDDDIPKDFFIENFDLKNGGLSHVTINFDSGSRRLLISTAETNYAACSIVALRTQPATFCSLSASFFICASRQRFVVQRVMYHLARIFGEDRHTTAGVKRPGST